MHTFDAEEARNVVLDDRTVHAFVAAAYARDAGLGLLVDVLAATGTKAGQMARLRVEDLRDHPTEPKLMMPKLGKGRALCLTDQAGAGGQAQGRCEGRCTGGAAAPLSQLYRKASARLSRDSTSTPRR